MYKKRNDITHEILKQKIFIENMTQREVAKYFKVSEACISKKMKEFGINKDIKDKYIGKTFGQLTPTSFLKRAESGHAIFKCLCDCGKEIEVISHSLLSGNTKSCGCTSRKRGKDHPNYKGYESINSGYWSRTKKGAKERNLEFNISIEYAWDVYNKQGRRCALSGSPIFFSQTRKNQSNSTASIDRIDSSKGYIEGNIWWVHKDLNVSKWNFSIERFFEICKQVTIYNNLLEK